MASPFFRHEKSPHCGRGFGPEVIDFSIGAPNIPPAPHITKVLSEEALKPENYLYAIVDLPELLEAVARGGIGGAMG